MKITIKITTTNKCLYCNKPAIKITCGSATCQMKRHYEKMKVWWKKKGKLWNAQCRKFKNESSWDKAANHDKPGKGSISGPNETASPGHNVDKF
jgi:hypothetical protein